MIRPDPLHILVVADLVVERPLDLVVAREDLEGDLDGLVQDALDLVRGTDVRQAETKVRPLEDNSLQRYDACGSAKKRNGVSDYENDVLNNGCGVSEEGPVHSVVLVVRRDCQILLRVASLREYAMDEGQVRREVRLGPGQEVEGLGRDLVREDGVHLAGPGVDLDPGEVAGVGAVVVGRLEGADDVELGQEVLAHELGVGDVVGFLGGGHVDGEALLEGADGVEVAVEEAGSAKLSRGVKH